MAISAPDAPAPEFRTLCDWGNWVFPFDDMFDDGELRDKPVAAANVIQSLLSPMSQHQTGHETSEPRLPIGSPEGLWRHSPRSITIHYSDNSGVQRRFAKKMSDYCSGALIQVQDFATHKTHTPEETFKTRQLSAGASPIFALVEYAHALRIPDYVFEHPAIREIEVLCVDFVLIINDALSYKKEESEAVPHNLVAAARMSGLGAQEAFDYIGSMLTSRFERWEKAVSEVPDWGEDVNSHVEKYIQGVADIARANLNWSFESGRYLGKDGPVVRQTRCLQVLRSPAFVRSVEMEAPPAVESF
ncbi:hypothetical protein NUW58_g3108 [Xylaria curta]|uniref:Uncharacterized protein n=1 Tax=Xylaria curta TaxID=42375 RepID=A0ACC1PEU0_9PEZI|nr:hypothetical protein NUW58_g3108 [Xylaria curta]